MRSGSSKGLVELNLSYVCDATMVQRKTNQEISRDLQGQIQCFHL